MSGGRYIKEAMIAAICEHPNQDEYSKKAFNIDNLPGSSMGVDSLTKQDFLTPDDDGVYIVDTPGFWKNLDKVLAILDKNGESFSYDDFVHPLKKSDDRNLLESAIDHGGLEKLFSFDVWKGHFDDMDLLWYHVPVPLRKELFKNEGLIDLDLKRRLLQFEGQPVPEDGLRQAGLSTTDIFNAFSDRGDYNDVKRKLAQQGDYLRKSYLLLTDADGDTLFHQEKAWKVYQDLAKNLADHDERFEAADFLRKAGTRQNILERGAHHGQLHKIFTPELWVGHLSEMVDLWKYMKPGWKVGALATEKFDGYYAEAEDLSYRDIAKFDDISNKADLFTRLSPDEDGVAKVVPLGLKSFWDHVETVEGKLKSNGEKLNLSDLREVSGELGNSCLMTAVKCGQFEKVASFVEKSGDKLSLDDFLVKDRHGNTMLNILAEQRELSKVFAPNMWLGRVTEMKQLWTHVRLDDRKQLDFLKVEVATKQATLKSKSSRKGKFKL